MASPFLGEGFLPAIPSPGVGTMAIGGSITSGTQGSVLFAGASGVLAQNNASFFWDDSNAALGIGTATPNTPTGSKLTVYPDADNIAVIGKLRIGATTPTADHAYLSHFDFASSATTYQIRLDPDGDVNIQTGAAAGTIALNGNNASASTVIQHNGTTRIQVNATGIGFFATAAVAKQTGPTLTITNSITSGGTDGTFTNWTDLTTYATDAAAIRNAVYQVGRTAKFCSDALRAYGLLT